MCKMRPVNVSYVGPAIDDLALVTRLPEEIISAFRLQNGWIVADGGFHVRGACLKPDWHSLRAAWEGEFALCQLYSDVRETDIPIAEDVFGDQYLIREDRVVHLSGETGEVGETRLTWMEFLLRVEKEPIEFLQLSYLEEFRKMGENLLPGQLLSAYPPFCTKEGAEPSLRPVPSLELRAYHADFARQIKNAADGQKIKIVIR